MFEYTTLYLILSTIFLIFLYPYASIFVYKIALKFSKQKRNIKNKIENEQCLTIGESIEIRTEIEKQKEVSRMVTIKRADEIKKLKQEVELYKNKFKDKIDKKEIKNIQNSTENTIADSSNYDIIYGKDFKKFKNTNSLEDLDNVSTNINENNHIKGSINYFIASKLIEMIDRGHYKLTEKGRYFLKRLYEEQEK